MKEHEKEQRHKKETGNCREEGIFFRKKSKKKKNSKNPDNNEINIIKN